MASAELEYILLRCRSDDVNNSRSIFLLIETLKNHVVTSLFVILYKLVLVSIRLNHKWICLLANFALESLPKERTEVW